MVVVSETNIVNKKEAVSKDNHLLFYLGKDGNGLKYFFEKPIFCCGWYYSINNIIVYSKNMRGILFTDMLGYKEESLTDNRYLVESTCNLQELLNKINETIPFLDELKKENNPKKVYELVYDYIPNKLVEIEKLITNNSKHVWELKDSYVNQLLEEVKTEIERKLSIIRYMIFNDVNEFGMMTVEQHIQALNEYRNKFILFKI